MGEIRNMYKILFGKPEAKRSLGRPSDRWEDNVRVCLRETVWESVDRMHLAQDKDQWRALLNMVMNFQVP